MLTSSSKQSARLSLISLFTSVRRPMSMAYQATRPLNWKAAAPEPLPGTITFAAQANLPKLPVPDLHMTLARLKESLKPIAWDNAEYAAVERKIDDFARGKGPELHARLLKRHAETKHWLEQWWDDAAYLGYRDSVVVNVSYYYGFDAQPPHLPQTPAGRAAGITRAAMIFRQKLKRGLLEPEGTKEAPLCMDSFRWMFDCCRIPGPNGLDWSISYAKPGDLGDSGHIIVFRKNRPWKVETAKDGRILSTEELERQIQHIYDNTTYEYPGVGVLTASNRDVWAKDYAELASSPHNSAILNDIQSAAFTISLDTSTPTTPVHHSRALWHGDISNGIPVGLQNRWVDKPVQFIVFDNSYAGIMGEHSMMDGTPTATLCDYALDLLYHPSFDHGSASSAVSATPTPLDWDISPDTAKAVANADAAAKELIESQALSYYLTSYGKAAIKKFGVSPDSWAQMIIQLAYKRVIGNNKRQGATYEAASTRRFYKGRTEAIRVVSEESDAWVRSMDDPRVESAERKRLFDVATKKHVALAKSSGIGQGVDRYLFGLKKLLQEGEELPAFFSDPVFVRSSKWVLSTSAVFSKHFRVYGWGEVVPDGFGIAYMTGYDDRLQYTITCRKEMPGAKFYQEIAKAASDLYDLHSEIHEKAKL